MNKLVILLFLLAAVLFTAGCTEEADNPDDALVKSVVEDVTDLEQINTSVQKGPVFVKVGAEWCGPCQQMKPILSYLAAEYTGKATVMSADIDQSPQLATYFSTSYIPDSFVVVGLENGEYIYMQEDGSVTTNRLKARVIGVRDKQVYKELMARAVLYYENTK